MAEKRPVVKMGTIIARRVFGVAAAPRRHVVVTFGRPRAVPGWDWACPVSIKGLPGLRPTPRPVFGIDAMQALEQAFQYARVTLWNHAPKLTWLGYRGALGFPGSIPWYLPRKIQRALESEVQRVTLKFWSDERRKRARKRASARPGQRSDLRV